jgi:hypothetical protein
MGILAEPGGPVFITGAGTAFSFIPVSIGALAGITEQDAGVASGHLNTANSSVAGSAWQSPRRSRRPTSVLCLPTVTRLRLPYRRVSVDALGVRKCRSQNSLVAVRADRLARHEDPAFALVLGDGLVEMVRIMRISIRGPAGDGSREISVEMPLGPQPRDRRRPAGLALRWQRSPKGRTRQHCQPMAGGMWDLDGALVTVPGSED